MSIVGRSIERAMRRSGVTCLSAALIDGGQVVGSEGFGVTADTVFAVASLSKPPFAYLVLRLCDRGLLDLDTPLAEFYPEPYSAFGLDPDAPELRRITARQVLSHTSGLGNMQADDSGRILFSPGSRWHYSGEGYLYLQAVVEHVVGSPLERIAAAEVFETLGMTSTSYLWRPDGDSSTQGHEFRKAFAAFSLHTTASDYARFLVHTMQSEIGEAMLVPQVAVDESIGWGLGWGLAGDVFWHWGEMLDFECVAVASRAEGRGLVCLANSAHALERMRGDSRGRAGSRVRVPDPRRPRPWLVVKTASIDNRRRREARPDDSSSAIARSFLCRPRSWARAGLRCRLARRGDAHCGRHRVYAEQARCDRSCGQVERQLAQQAAGEFGRRGVATRGEGGIGRTLRRAGVPPASASAVAVRLGNV